MTRGRMSFRSSGSTRSTAMPLMAIPRSSFSETLMATREKDIPETFEFRDTDRAHPSGVARMAHLRTVAAIKAEALALYYFATGKVATDVPEELQDAAYDIRRGKVNPLGGIDRFATILVHRATKRTLTRNDARRYAEQMLEYARQLIELRLPVNPGPMTGHAVPITHTTRESLRHRGVGGRTLGSIDDYDPKAA